MKFICDQCKAKYQISDDKVAGKTVKMKCRKCGHMIEVRAAVTETSVASSTPKDDAADRPSAGSPREAAGAAKPPGAPPRPGQGKTQPLATSLTGARPPGAARPTSPGAPRGPATGALAGAFQRNVRDDDGAVAGGADPLREISAADEWYAAINGVPVGPIRIAELRRKAALGAVTEDSLVWQEGLEEWRPVRAFPELADIVREAAAVGRPSLLPPTSWDPAPQPSGPGGRTPSVRPPAPARTPASTAPVAPAAPRLGTGQQQAVAKSNVIPFAGRLATAEKLDEPEPASARQPAVVADPFALPPPAVDPFASVPAPSGASAPLAPPAAAMPPAPESRRADKKAVPWIPIAMVALAVAFGVTFAVVLAMPKPQQPQAAPAPSVIIIEKPVPAAPASAAPETVAAAPSASAAPAARPAAVASKPASAPSTGRLDLGGLLGNGPAPGGPSGAPAGAGGGGALTSDQIQAVVASRKVAIRRACVERAETQAGNVTVRAKVTIGGNGLVQNVSASGNDPAISACIEKNVKTWTFPAAGGTTTVEIPFSFVRQ